MPGFTSVSLRLRMAFRGYTKPPNCRKMTMYLSAVFQVGNLWLSLDSHWIRDPQIIKKGECKEAIRKTRNLGRSREWL